MPTKYQDIIDIKNANPNLSWTQAANQAGYEGKWTASGSGGVKPRTGNRAEQARRRSTGAAGQTVGEDVYRKGVVTPKGSKLQEHHKRAIGLYAPFFEGLNAKEIKELAQWFVDEGFPLGNVKDNLLALSEKNHDAIHRWMKENKIQVSSKKFPSFKGVPLNERFPAALIYLEQIQKAVDEATNLIQKTDGIVPNKSGIHFKTKALQRFAPGAGLALGLEVMSKKAMAGDMQGVLGEGISTVVGEVLPGIGDLAVLEAEGRPAGAGSDIPKGMSGEEVTQAMIKKGKTSKNLQSKIANEIKWAANNPVEAYTNVTKAHLSTALSAGKQALENPILNPYTLIFKGIMGGIRLFNTK